MEGVSFEEEQNAPTRKAYPTDALNAWLIRSTLAKDEKEANQIMLGVVVAAVLLGLGIFFFGPGKVSHKFPPPPPTGFVPGQTGVTR